MLKRRGNGSVLERMDATVDQRRPTGGQNFPAGLMPLQRISRLFQPVDIASLAFFRMAFGLCLIFHIVPLAKHDSAFYEAAAPAVRLAYPGLEWIPQMPEDVMRVLLLGMVMAAVGTTLGLAYRFSIVFYALGAAYLHFSDAGKFHNNYYLMVLLSVLLVFMPAHGASSFDALFRPGLRRKTTPFWTMALLRFQVGIPFLFSGLSKLNGDWLHGLPAIYHWHSFTLAHAWARSLPPETMALLIARAGVVMDLSLFPLLLWPRTRLFGFALAILFNLGNLVLFSGPAFKVGMFPWIMMAGVTVFLSPDWPRRAWMGLRKLRGAGSSRLMSEPVRPDPDSQAGPVPLRAGQKVGVVLVCSWMLIQVLVPLRYLLYPGFANWTESGHTHAWQMMSSHKVGRTVYVVSDPATGETWKRTTAGAFRGRRHGMTQVVPALIWQYGMHIQRQMAERGHPDCEVRVDSFVVLNGRKPQRYVDPSVDITAAPPRRGFYSWVLPLEEPRPELNALGPSPLYAMAVWQRSM